MEFRDMSESEYGQYILMRIRSLMSFLGMKQLELAEISGIGQSTLSKIIKGEMKLTLQHIFKLCKALEIEPTDLLSIEKDICSITGNAKSFNNSDNSLISESYINNQILIRNTNHPVFKGYIDNTFFFYCYPTISTESNLLEGELSFYESQNKEFCHAKLKLYTGQISTNKEPVYKLYSGELITSLTMGTCYCILINSDIGEVCCIDFKHTFLFNQELICRVGAMISTSSGGNKLPIMQRILISKHKLNVNDIANPDYMFIRGQLNLNDSTMYIPEEDFSKLLAKDNSSFKHLLDFFNECDNYMETRSYKVIDESKIRDIPVQSDVKSQGISILRQFSTALKYNKISTKTEEFVFQYINNKENTNSTN